jgi:hypothetical protein
MRVSGLVGLRRLEIQALLLGDIDQGNLTVEGLSGLTALEDLRLEGECEPLAQPSDLAPLTALTRLAMTCVPPELTSHTVAARLRWLELQAFGVVEAAPKGGAGSGAKGAAAAALAALARGAPLLERLRIRVERSVDWDRDFPFPLGDHACDVALGAPLGPGVAWPSLTHLHVTSWAALLLAGCAFPQLSRFSACITEGGGEFGITSNQQLRTAVAALAAKARDHAALLIDDYRSGAPDTAGVLAAAAAVPGLRHLSWDCSWHSSVAAAAAPPGDWARLAASLESLELAGPLAACGYAEPLAALTGLTRLFLAATSEAAATAPPPRRLPTGAACEGGEPPMGPAGSAPARSACALARLPRLAHLRLVSPKNKPPGKRLVWGRPVVAAELARCGPALQLLEIDRRDGPLWQHQRGSPPLVPLPSHAWPPFSQALRAGGFGATVRPAPEDSRDRLWVEI